MHALSVAPIQDYFLTTACIVMQTKDDKLLESVTALKEEIPRATVCVHYALKWNYGGSMEAGMDNLQTFLGQMGILDATVLLVSGGGKTRQLDTVEVSLGLSVYNLQELEEGVCRKRDCKQLSV